MAKSRARYLAELLNSEGLVQTSLSALAGADGIIDLEVLPTIPNSQLEHSSVSIAGHSLSLGGSLSLDTADIGEHVSYLYFTNARARAALSVSGSLSYDSATGIISYTTPTTISSLSNHTTDGLTEGSTNLYYTTARFDTAFSGKSTTDLTEGTNLYFTNARADARITAASIGDLSDVDITSTAPTSTQVLKWDAANSKFIPGDAASSVANLTDVDLTGLANNSVLKYDSTAGEWVVGTNSTAQATANIIRPFAYAHITLNNYAANSGIAMSWGTYQYSSGNYGYYQFTFANPQPNANYAVMTDMVVAGDINISAEVSNRTTTGFRVNFYDANGNELNVGSVATYEPLIQVYSSTPTETIYADSYSSVGDLPDVTITSAADNNILQWNSSSSVWENVAGTTSNIAEGTNLYFTNARARGAISVAGAGSYDSGTGVITITGGVTSVNTQTGAVTLTTDNISEGSTNLYYTDARVGSYLTANTYATQSYVTTAISNLVDSAPATLDTLNELAAALGDDANFSTTVTNSIATKWTQDNTKISNWDTAYGWGNHASAGYQPASTALTTSTTFGGDVSGTYNAIVVANDSHSHTKLSGFSGQTEYDLIRAGNTNGLYFKARWDGATANRYWDMGYVDGFGTFYTGLKVYNNGALVYKDNTVWHAGNDGSSSGLDADLLDGQHGSYYAPASSLSGYVAKTGDTMSGELTFQDDHEGITFFGGGRFYKQSGQGLVIRKPNGGQELRFEDNSGNYLGTFWHSGNDGSGSGLDADLLDGQHGSYYYSSANPPPYPSDADTVDGLHAASFLRSDANDTATGVITFSNVSDYQIHLDGAGGAWAGIRWSDVNGSDYIWYNGQNSTYAIGGGGANVAGKKLHVNGGLSVGTSVGGTATPTNGIYSEGALTVPLIYGSAGNTALELNHATYTILSDPEGARRIYLGDSGDSGNYYDNTVHYFRDRSANPIATLSGSGLNLQVGGYQVNGTTRINSVGDGLFTSLYIGSTNIVDTNRNLTNIGTISSGAITTTGAVSIGAVNNTYNFKAFGQDANSFFGVYDDANNSANIILTRSDGATIFRVLGHTGATTIAGTLSSETINIASGHSLSLGGTTVIDSSRNLTNIGTISSGTLAITHTNLSAEPYSGLTITNTSTSGAYYTGVTVDAVGQSHYRYKLNGALKWQTRVGAGSGTDDFRVYSWTGAADVLLGNPSGQWTATGDFRAPIFYDSNDTSYLLDPSSTSRVYDVRANYLTRPGHSEGHLVGSYNNVGANSQYTNPIYTIGSSYNPTNSDLVDMYGIGYTHPNANYDGISSVLNGWGMYVAAGGQARIGLSGDDGVGIATTSWRAPIFYDSNDTSFYLDPTGSSLLRTVYTQNASYHFRPRYTDGSDNYSGSFNWYGLQLGNNGANYIVAGRTVAGGSLDIYVNNTSDFPSINGTHSSRFSSDGIFYNYYSVRAPYFYDYNDTAYFADPAGTSVMQYVYGLDSTFTAPGSPGTYVWVRASMGGFNGGGDVVRFTISRSISDNSASPYGGPSAEFTVFSREWHSGQEFCSVLYGEHGSGSGTGGYYISNAGPRDLQGSGYWFYMRVEGGITYKVRRDASSGPISNFSETTDPGGVPAINNHGYNLLYTSGQTGATPGIYSKGSIYSDGSEYSNAFYDRANTSFFTDPAATSQIRKTNLFALGAGWDDGLNLYSSDLTNRWNLLVDEGAGDIFRLAFNNSEAFGVGTNGEAYFTAGLRATIYYDRNDTGYYVDPNGVSFLNGPVTINGNDNQLRINGTTGSKAAGVFFQQDGVNKYELYYYSGQFRFYNYARAAQEMSISDSGVVTVHNDFRAPIMYDANDTGYYLDPASACRVNQINFTAYNSPNAIVVGDGDVNWTFGSSYDGGSQYWMQTKFYGTNDDNRGFRVYNVANSQVEFRINGGGVAYARDSFRAPIFYDSNNTGYYVDPAGATSAKFAQFVQIGDSSSYATNSGSWGARLNVTDNVHAKIEVGQDADGMLSHWYAHTGQSSVKFGTQSSHDLEIQRGSTQKIYIGASETTSYNPLVISANWGTGSYSDALTVYGTYPSITLRSTNANGGTGQTFLMHTDSSGTIQYYFDTSGPNEGWTKRHEFFSDGRFYANASVRSPIFYDMDNTAFYTDPSSDSRMARLLVGDGGNYIRIGNEGEGYNNSYARIRTDSSGNLFLDAKDGQNIYLSWYTGTSARIYSEAGAAFPIYYDRNNSGYYVDPESSSNCNDMYAYSYRGNGNVAGTGNASYHPSGIYSTGTNWLYGTMYLNGNNINSVNRVVCDANYGEGVYGVYNSYRYQHVWMMSTSYKLASDGTSVGNAYGMSYTHPNVGTGTNQAIAGLSHQLQGREAGNLVWALGTGIWTAYNITAYSDRAVKTNLEIIPDALAKVCQLNGYTYDRTDYKPDPLTGEMPETRQAGVVAQEVEKVLPEVVSGEEGNKSVAYGNMVGLLIEAIKELKAEVDDLKSQLKEK